MTPEQLQQMSEAVQAVREASQKALAQMDAQGKNVGDLQGKLGEYGAPITKATAALDRMEQDAKAAYKRIEDAEAKAAAQAKQIEELQAMLSRQSKGAAAQDDANLAMSRLAKAALMKQLRVNDRGDMLSAPTPEELDAYKASVKAFTLGNDVQTGYLAVPEYVTEILKNVVEFSNLRPLVTTRTTGKAKVVMPRRTRTAAATWVGEITTRSETQNPQYGLLEIPIHEQHALMKVSWQDMEDSEFNLEAEIRAEIAEQFGLSEGTAIVSGTGVGQLEGIITSSEVTAVDSGTSASFSADDFIKVFYDLKEAYTQNSTWVMNRATLMVIRTLKDGENRYIWQPNMLAGITSDARPASLLDRPYVSSPDMPTKASSTIVAVFGDLRRGYVLVDRLGTSFMTDPFTSKAHGFLEISARRRLGGRVRIGEALRTLRCAA